MPTQYWSAWGFLNGRPAMDRLLYMRIWRAMNRLGIPFTAMEQSGGKREYYECFAGVDVEV